jgi:hypothetical protein
MGNKKQNSTGSVNNAMEEGMNVHREKVELKK